VKGHTRSYIFFQDAAEEILAYRRLRQLCENRAADVLVCRGRDRLGGTDALIAQVEALAKAAGMQIYSMTMPATIVEPGRANQDRGSLYIAAIERASAEAELVELRRRHQQGMRARIRKGLLANNAPFGYRREGDGAVQYPPEVKLVRKMGELYMKGWGYPRIAGYLNQHGYKPPRAKAWRDSTVRVILHNRFYMGLVFCGAASAPGNHQPIWSQKEWAMIQQEHRRRKRTRGKQASVFSGLVRCRQCNYSMIFHRKITNDIEYRYSRCQQGATRAVERRADPHHNMIRIERIGEAVLAKAQELLYPQALEAACKNTAAEERDILQDKKAELEKTLQELSAEVKRLIEDHARWGRVAVDQFDELMTEAEQRKRELVEVLGEVSAQLEGMPEPEIRAKQLYELATDIEGILNSKDIKEASAWLAQRVKNIWIKDGKVDEVELI